MARFASTLAAILCVAGAAASLQAQVAAPDYYDEINAITAIKKSRVSQMKSAES